MNGGGGQAMARSKGYSHGVKLARQMHAIAENRASEESLDFAQALNTALCFLCWINADIGVIEAFLKAWPEALLLEGIGQDCAGCIVEQRMKRCSCSDGAFNNNRRDVLKVITRGYQHYQKKHMQQVMKGKPTNPLEASIAELNSTSVFPQLMATGRYLRGLAVEESSVHGQVLELHVAKVTVEGQLADAKASAKKKKAKIRSLFVCGSERAKDQEALISRLEFEAQMAEMKLQSAEKEHNLLVGAIDQGHRKQYTLLKDVFEGCPRHECDCGNDKGRSEEHYSFEKHLSITSKG